MEQGDNLKGINSISGWLIVVQVFIVLNAFGWIRNLQLFYGLLGEKDRLIQTQRITDPFLYNAFIYYEIIASLIFITFSIILVYYMFKRSRFFPFIFILYLVLDLFAEALVVVAFSAVSETPLITREKLIFGLAIAVFLISYIRFSKRVKLTFVN
jgi:Protein of unknown function (DUF2569)